MTDLLRKIASLESHDPSFIYMAGKWVMSAERVVVSSEDFSRCLSLLYDELARSYASTGRITLWVRVDGDNTKVSSVKPTEPGWLKLQEVFE